MKCCRKASAVATAAASILLAGAARAGNQLYSMEQLYNTSGVPADPPAGIRPDDFHPNGGGVTITQDVVGVTEQAHSMKYTMVAGATFAGAETELLPDHLSDDNTAITMDVTIPSTGQFTGTFANIGITEFGISPNSGSGSCQVLGEAETSIALAPGTYHIGIPLIARSNPFTFEQNVSFFSCFGPDPNTQMVPADWEFFVNKSNDSALTIYVDNIRSIAWIPGDANFDGKVNALDFNSLVTNFGIAPLAAMYYKGDFNFDTHIDSLDFTILASHFNQTTEPAPPLGALAPEPAGGLAVVGFGAALAACRRGRRGMSTWAGNSEKTT